MPSLPHPPWEVVILLSRRLDPKTLAVASGVSRSWCFAMSSDDLWRPIYNSHFPSLSSLLLLHPQAQQLPSGAKYRALFALLRSVSPRRRRRDPPPPPRLSLSQLTFAVDVFHGDTPALSVVKRGATLEHAGSDHDHLLFRFELIMGDEGVGEADVEVQLDQLPEEAGKLRAVWAVVLAEGGAAAMVLVECREKGRVMGAARSSEEVWFSEELPPPVCCSGPAAAERGQLVAEVGLQLGRRPCELGAAGGGGGGGGAAAAYCGDHEKGGVARRKRRVIMGVKVGLMSMESWRYVSVDDGLRYLQHFFPSSTS